MACCGFFRRRRRRKKKNKSLADEKKQKPAPPSYEQTIKRPEPSAPPSSDWSFSDSDSFHSFCDESDEDDAESASEREQILQSQIAELEAELEAHKSKARRDKKKLRTKVRALEKALGKSHPITHPEYRSPPAIRAQKRILSNFGLDFYNAYRLECGAYIDVCDSVEEDFVCEIHIARLRELYKQFVETGRANLYVQLDTSGRLTHLTEVNRELRRQMRSFRLSAPEDCLPQDFW